MKKTIITLCGAAAVLAAVLISAAACSGDMGGANSDGGGGGSQGGSMARFTISGDYLYTVDNTTLKTVSIATPDAPVEIASQSRNIGWDIETIFADNGRLFIGSMQAMYIYDISNPLDPQQLSMTSHFKSCDPVVAYDTLAFVTLNSDLGQWCGRSNNVLQVYNIKDVTNPRFVIQKDIASPRGLAVDGGASLVFVCGRGGVVAYEFKASEVSPFLTLEIRSTTELISQMSNIDTYDCIALPGGSGATAGNGTLLIVGADGLYQLAYDKSSENHLFTFLSKIDIRKE